MMHPDGSLNVIGAPRAPMVRDVYHRLISGSWLQLLAVLALGFFGSNAIFALAYLAGGNAIENARPGSYTDAYFFSVQTMATIGYGQLTPVTVYANTLVAIESFLGLLGLAIATGLIFAKFSRPMARVLFSRVAIVGPRDGVRSLMLRIANERASQIVEASVHAVLVRNETTIEGEEVRRFYDLDLTRRKSAIFALSWTVVHPITETSPLAGATAASMAADETEILVSVVGLDAALNQTIHARHDYAADDIVWNARFVDILGRTPSGQRKLELGRFHETLPAALLSLILCLSLSGCSAIPGAQYFEGLTNGGFNSSQITQEELRDALIQYANRFDATVVATANTIAAGSKDPLVQRRALRWKLELTPVVNQAVFASEPESAYVSILTVATSMHDYLTTGTGAEVFGSQQQLAVDASAELLAAAVALGDRFLDDKQLARVTNQVNVLVHEQPIRGEFVAEKIQTLMTASESSGVFDWITAIPMSPFRALRGVDQGAQAIREFNNTAAEMSRLVAAMPRLVRWNLELFALDVTQQGDIESTLRSFDALARSAESLSQSAATLPGNLHALLEEAERTGQSLGPLSQSLERSATAVAAAGTAWGAIVAELSKPPADPTKPSRPFDIREWEQTAAEINSAATELRALLETVSTLAGSETLAGPLADLTARVERVEAGSRALVNLAAVRALQLLLAFFVLLFVYRRIERRLARRGAAR